MTKRSAQLDATSSPIVRPLSAWCRKCPSLDERGQKVDRRGAGPMEACPSSSCAFLRLTQRGRPVIPGNSLLALLLQRIGKQLQGEDAGSV